jgi:ankyrin repeat protein
MVNLLIAKGANVNAIENTGATPVHLATHYGLTDLVASCCSIAEMDMLL